jgi:hypothetical protein
MTQQSLGQDLLDIVLADPEPRAPTPAPPAKPAARHFYRCSDCLSVVTVDEELPWYQDDRGVCHKGKCGACGGWIEYLGRTQRKRLVRDEDRCPCDARCTHARGPNCDCRCGGANHGSHAWVRVTIDAGGIPVVQTPPDAASKAEQYWKLVDAAHEAVEARYGRYFAMKRAGEYLQYGDFRQYLDGCAWVRAIHAAQKMRSHAGRNKKLTRIATEVG